MKLFLSINKRILIILVIFISSFFKLVAQNDTLYIMKGGLVIDQFDVNTDIDSIIFYEPIIDSSYFTFTDPRDGNVYKTVQIGGQIWMAENLKYLPYVVYMNTFSNTDPRYYVYGYHGLDLEVALSLYNYNTYGALYNWKAAINGGETSSSNPSGVQGVCPNGWHLPSVAEWEQLAFYVGGSGSAGLHLKAQEGWNGNDTYGFTALPGGALSYELSWVEIGQVGMWWTATYDQSQFPKCVYLRSSMNSIQYSTSFVADGLSVRCVKD